MSIQEQTVAKIQNLPDTLAQEVNDFVDFLVMKHDAVRRQCTTFLAESGQLAELGMADYLSNLEEYEDLLARGEIQW
jgi:Protein of unknown function (DUF2281)